MDNKKIKEILNPKDLSLAYEGDLIRIGRLAENPIELVISNEKEYPRRHINDTTIKTIRRSGELPDYFFKFIYRVNGNRYSLKPTISLGNDSRLLDKLNKIRL